MVVREEVYGVYVSTYTTINPQRTGHPLTNYFRDRGTSVCHFPMIGDETSEVRPNTETKNNRLTEEQKIERTRHWTRELFCPYYFKEGRRWFNKIPNSLCKLYISLNVSRTVSHT